MEKERKALLDLNRTATSIQNGKFIYICRRKCDYEYLDRETHRLNPDENLFPKWNDVPIGYRMVGCAVLGRDTEHGYSPDINMYRVMGYDPVLFVCGTEVL